MCIYIYTYNMFNLQCVFQTTCCPEQFPHLVSLHLPVVHAILSAVTHQEDTVIQLSASPKTIGGGFKPWNKYESNWIISPIFRVKNKQYLKPPQILSKKTPKIPSVFDVIFGVRMRQKRVFLIDTTHHRVLCVGRNPKVGNIHFCGARSKNCCFYLEIFQYLLTLRGK